MADKYTKENLEDIRYILEDTGDKKIAMESIPITKGTWSKWLKKPVFASMVRNAISYHRRDGAALKAHRANRIEHELLSEEGSVTEIIDTVVVDKNGREHPITTTKKERGPQWLMKKMAEEGAEESKPSELIVSFKSLADEVAKKAEEIARQKNSAGSTTTKVEQ